MSDPGRVMALPAPETVTLLRELANRRLPVEEFDAYVNAPMSAEERESISDLIEWFTRRYPTPRERLAYSRRRRAEWRRRIPPSAGNPPAHS